MRLLLLAVAFAAGLHRSPAELKELSHGENATRRTLLRARGPENEWQDKVMHSPVNDALHHINDVLPEGYDIMGFDRPSDVNAFTCISLLLIFALVMAISWYHLPDGGECCGLSTRTLKISLLIVTWCMSGTAVMMFIEGYTLGTSVYIMAQIVTTVGYGDFTPTVWYTQVFMSFYVILCILVIAGVISSVADNVMSNFDQTLQSALSNDGKSPRTGTQLKGRFFSPLAKYQDIIAAATMFGTMVLAGTLYFGGFEGCTCSYGKTRIEGCSEVSQLLCKETGGNDLTYMQAFYMSCITLTTVGFGDFTPMSWHGRVFAAFWMLLGVACMGNFVRAFSEVFMQESKTAKQRHIDIQECFHKIDRDGDGTLDRFEFVSFVLLEHGLVTQPTLDAISKQYDSLDVNGEEKVTLQMIMEHETGGVITMDPQWSGRDTPGREASGASALLRTATKAAQNK